MEREQIDALFKKEQPEQMIKQLEEALEEEYEEYTMYRLAQAYLLKPEADKAKKLIRRSKMLFPNGEYSKAVDEMLAAISANTIEAYIQASGIQKSSPRETTVGAYFTEVVGLEGVQKELEGFYKLLHFQKERQKNDYKVNLIRSTHFMIIGASGCGKTLVAKILAQMLYDFELRKESAPIVIEAKELLSAYENNRKNGIVTLLKGALGKTLIIENMEVLLEEANLEQRYGRDVLLCLEAFMKEQKEKVSMILTGDAKQMGLMKTILPTMEDTIQQTLEISSYSTMELLEIAKLLAKKKALRIHESAQKALIRKIDMERRSPEFMNAITINRYLDQAAGKMAARFYDMSHSTQADMVYLLPQDFGMEYEEESLEQLIAELDGLTGLDSVKKQVKKRIQNVSAQQAAANAGASRVVDHGSLHMLFTGNPGTGKTTVARMLGKIYQQLGILPRGSHVVECTRSNLVGEYQGHTAKQVQKKFKEAAGGILFIDEAYALCRDANDSFGHEAVDEIIAQMENHKDSMLVILAGYKKEMEAFLKTNPGFDSRIRNRIEFEDYTIAEMAEIFRGMAKTKRMRLNYDADEILLQMLEIKSKTPNFGNARGVRNLFEEVLEVMNERLLEKKALGMSILPNEYDIICKEDIQTVAGRKLDGEKSLEELLEELNALTGLQGVKRQVQEMVDEILVKQMMKEQGLETSSEHGTLHLIFKGNAGTGKTTVARLLGKIYTKLGILKKNVFIETGRSDLVAGYSGQTALKVIEKVEAAEGGILFIDEVYTLVNGEQDELGKEAVNTLVAELENRRNSLMVIVAGYADKMENFLSVNQGLASRLSNEILFEDYSKEELFAIFQQMLKQKHMRLESGCEDAVRNLIVQRKNQVKDFGNARGVRNLLEQIERKKNSRIVASKRKGEELTKEDFVTIKLEDIKLEEQKG